jgi:hypothetical protein
MLQPGKMMEIADEVLKLGTDLVALQEIRWEGHGAINKKTFTPHFQKRCCTESCMQQDEEEDQK